MDVLTEQFLQPPITSSQFATHTPSLLFIIVQMYDAYKTSY